MSFFVWQPFPCYKHLKLTEISLPAYLGVLVNGYLCHQQALANGVSNWLGISILNQCTSILPKLSSYLVLWQWHGPQTKQISCYFVGTSQNLKSLSGLKSVNVAGQMKSRSLLPRSISTSPWPLNLRLYPVPAFIIFVPSGKFVHR